MTPVLPLGAGVATYNTPSNECELFHIVGLRARDAPARIGAHPSAPDRAIWAGGNYRMGPTSLPTAVTSSSDASSNTSNMYVHTMYAREDSQIGRAHV